jgi:putative molybdopterin biosynthesis protein
VRFINRNEGSGTRVLLEYLLGEKGLADKEIVGFANEVDTHLEVALKVLFGEADAGLGIEYVAHLLPLDFIPLREERFDLVLPKELWPTQVMKRFLSYVNPASLHRLMPIFPGYNLQDTGKIIFES